MNLWSEKSLLGAFSESNNKNISQRFPPADRACMTGAMLD
uniref:Uncharacterized protein n=1 Tax=uncultured marine bacterium 581 TaxID=257401 RepID=Q6SFA5_9BACT|nr:hypothetical protein MBMO_EBAC000-69B03.66 [uncultured marine bacterium 581]